MSQRISRRSVLRGVGAAVALPLLDAMIPFRGTTRAAASESNPSLQRMMFIYVPNGAVMKHWTPAAEGSDYELPQILEPLAAHRSEMLVLSGLAHRTADPNGDGPGDHARASASFLTGVQARKTASVDIRLGVSVDQVAAAHIGEQSRFASLELGCDKGKQAGACDSGYSCAYQFNLAWKTPTLPLPPEVDPRLVFERLFSTSDSAQDRESSSARQAVRSSILDLVMEDARKLRGQVGNNDVRKLDQYLDSVRDLERQIERSERVRAALPPGTEPIDEIPEDYQQHMRLLLGLAVLAFQTDSTRVITFMVAHDGSNRSYPFIDVPEGHHDLSHHGGDEEKQAKISKINRFHVEQFAWLLEQMKGVREGEHSLLDQSLLVYGSGIADGDEHSHYDLPVILAGRGGGAFEPGRHVRFEKNTPMSNLYLTMLRRIGIQAEQFGDSTGPLDTI